MENIHEEDHGKQSKKTHGPESNGESTLLQSTYGNAGKIRDCVTKNILSDIQFAVMTMTETSRPRQVDLRPMSTSDQCRWVVYSDQSGQARVNEGLFCVLLCCNNRL